MYFEFPATGSKNNVLILIDVTTLFLIADNETLLHSNNPLLHCIDDFTVMGYNQDSRIVNNVNYNDLAIRTYTDNSTLSYRTDGNNVDLSTENVELASEQINYNALIDSMNNEFSRFKAVLK